MTTARATTRGHRLSRRSVTGGADRYVQLVVVALMAFGVVAVYSAVSFLAETKAGGDPERLLLRHLVRVLLAAGAIAVVSRMDYRQLARWSLPLLVGALGLLLLVQVAGVAFGGATRWLRIGPLAFQPSELASVALLLHLSVLLTRKQSYIGSFERGFLPLLFWILVTAVLIGIENLSTAALLTGSMLLLCFVGRVRLVHLTASGLLGLLLATLMLLVSPQRAARVEAFLGAKIFPHTEAEAVFDPQQEGYQARQARIAFAMGGLTGVGPGKSTQRDFLPAPYNDFIFAIVAEEYGIIGAMLLLAALLVLLFRGYMRIARHAPDPLGFFLAFGATTLLVMQGFVHAAVTCGLLPVTGLPFPFVSYGGTSLLTSGILVGLLLSVSRQAQFSKKE
ncbi:FtsW/RodA/SpoVE family cell cycle protein [Rhodothermus profundi]|uniref:Probable peptidoglycan glycosyltransferase FtsW n=1 Tax=Rhodothermus profundi TaxID=633813 RepID=A0A1M6RFN3_9BACT|nr:FtsW/RodA/SpoVE family cell cycle protein [Rhodothermus profundi]SHK31220.1 cell division protein FtsW [Rhodothermus profundi]